MENPMENPMKLFRREAPEVAGATREEVVDAILMTLTVSGIQRSLPSCRKPSGSTGD